jgi:hypothetical protein
MRTLTPLFAALFALGACTGKSDEDTGEPVVAGEPDPYIVNTGLPADSGEWAGHLDYSFVHSYSYGSGGPVADPASLTAYAEFFAPSKWGGFDVMYDENGCWTDAWASGWTESVEVGTELTLGVGTGTATMTGATGGDGPIYVWNPGEDPEAWAITPGSALVLDGVETGVVVPEQLELPTLGSAWVNYDSDEVGKLDLEWEPPTVGDTWILITRREESGGYTRCHVKDDGEVSIQFGSRRDRNDRRLFISRVSSAELDHPTYGRITVYAEDVTLLDAG